MSKKTKKVIVQSEDEAEFDKAIKLRDDGKFSEALEILEQLRPRNSNFIALLLVIGQVHWEMENLGKAIESFQDAVRLSPKSKIASLGLFHCLWEMNRTDEAFDEMRRFQTISYLKDYEDIVAEIIGEDE